MTTYFGISALYAHSLMRRSVLPASALRSIRLAFVMANVQVLLGMSTLLYLVPVPLAACHQAGSVLLLTSMIHVIFSLRRPGQASIQWRQLYRQAAAKAHVQQ